MCPWKKPRSPPQGATGECGSRSRSERAWCSRCSATQNSMGPCADMLPRIDSSNATGRLAVYARWLYRRWNPAVIPSFVKIEKATNRPRSATRMGTCQCHTSAPTTAAWGTTMLAKTTRRATRAFARRSSLFIPARPSRVDPAASAGGRQCEVVKIARGSVANERRGASRGPILRAVSSAAFVP